MRELRAFFVRRIRPHLPPYVFRPLLAVYGMWVRLRLTSAATGLLGPRYRRARQFIDIDITWACNLRCEHCSRSCRQAPTGEHMTLGQVRRFIQESVDHGYRWRLINVLGGEPALHPRFHEILSLLIEYRDRHCPTTCIKVISNGYGDRVQEALARIPAGVIVQNTAKTSPVQQEFVPFNIAPVDTPFYSRADFRNACPVARDCGMGLTPYGFYPCPAAGGIDRIFGLRLGRLSLPDAADGMEAEFSRFCRLCGIFRMNLTADNSGGPTMTRMWREAYRRWRENPPRLPLYPEA